MQPPRRGYSRVTFRVSADVPNGATMADIKDFIREWLQSGGGCRHPEDPLFNSLENVTVATIKGAEDDG